MFTVVCEGNSISFIEELRKEVQRSIKESAENIIELLKRDIYNKAYSINNQTTLQLDSIHYVELMMLKLAFFMDNQYEDNIRSVEYPWTFDSNDGRIKPMAKSFWNKLKKQDNIVYPLFRTKEEAKLACSILREEIKATYGKR